jgi:hypothetical protein
MPCGGAIRASAGITKLENAKNTPAITAQPSAVTRVRRVKNGRLEALIMDILLTNGAGWPGLAPQRCRI